MILKASTSYGSHPIIVSFNRTESYQYSCFVHHAIRTETKQNTCVSLSYMPMYLYNDFFKTASESEKGACDSVFAAWVEAVRCLKRTDGTTR